MPDRGSIAFDRAAEYYDKTRSRPPDVAAREADALAAALDGRGRCFEPGVGTGRIALALHERGVEMVGLDLSRPMMERLVANAGGAAPFPLLQGDATRLPFASGSFGAAVLTHVLHLIPTWRDAVDELVRVVRTGGLLVINIGGAQGAASEINDHLRELLGPRAHRVGLTDASELDFHLAGRAPAARLVEIEVHQEVTAGQVIDRFASGRFSSAWDIDPADLARAADEARVWAADRFGGLDVAITEELRDVWRLYELQPP